MKKLLERLFDLYCEAHSRLHNQIEDFFHDNNIPYRLSYAGRVKLLPENQKSNWEKLKAKNNLLINHISRLNDLSEGTIFCDFDKSELQPETQFLAKDDLPF